jgi:uncharacterized protein YndB with AHSA1/START domain
MSEFVAKIEIDAPADEVFAYVTDISRMPEYMPTLHKATSAGDNRIRMQGEADGHPYDAEGWFQTHELERTMLWGSDGQNRYTGHLEVMSQGESSILTVTLNFEASSGMDKDFQKLMEQRKSAIQEGLEHSVQSIKSCCEEMPAPFSPRNSGYVI